MFRGYWPIRAGVFSLICAALFFGALAFPQATSTATVSGQVTDQQNAAVPGVDVTMVDPSTNNTLTASTNEAGRYVFVNVVPGTYNLTFSKQGFSTAKVQGQVVEVGGSFTVNMALSVGTTSTTVEVTATAGAELQTTNASVGTTLSSSSILALPNMGRDVSTLAVLQPGVTLSGYTAGAVFDQNTYTLDGGNISDDMAGNTTGYQTNYTGMGGTQTSGMPSGVIPAPVESIEELHVTTFNQGADFNNSLGSQVQMVTKRGTNQFHGAAYGYYFATDVGAANTWSNNHTPSDFNGVSLPYTPLVSNHRDRFGAALGGPLVPYKFLGGKTYFFFNYEGSRFPNATTYERDVPTALMRDGVIQVANSAGQYVPYNLNPFAVTVGGVTYPGSSLDPRGIGLNPIVSEIWNKYMPLPNDPNYGGTGADGYNTQGYLSTIRAPLDSDNWIGRIDHDFNDKWRWMTSYRYMTLLSLTTNQVDIGGALPGDSFGTPAAVAPRPQKPSYFNTGLTTNISANTINDFKYSYLRNFWQWSSANAPAQLPGLGGAVEVGDGAAGTAESTAALIPYNVNTQSVRQRFWDGQDNMLKDDITMIHGNHLFQFGGTYQRNFDYHSRTDNGNGINDQVVYQITSTGINFTNSPYIPSTVPTSQQSSYENLYSEVLGLVAQPQVVYSRAGANLALQPIGTPAFDKSVIPFYEEYFGDTWHVKPSLTFTYSLGYTIEMPPKEEQGKQVELVDSADQQVITSDYLAQRQKAALLGQVYDPELGFALVGNVGNGLKYPYNPFYGEWSPRASLAWNPKATDGLLGKILGNGKTVIRGGYSRIWGRLNGVNLVLVPLLGVGLLQPVTCAGASMTGQCLGTGNVTAATAFRIGTDGLVAPLPAASPTLSQPFYPGVNGNASAGDVDALDPNYRPERTDNFTISIQREVARVATFEVGYMGRIIRNEYQTINLDAVPTMTTLDGQSFAQAFGALYTEMCGLNGGAICANPNLNNVVAQPFFEAALGGASASFCQGYSSCTAAVAAKETSLIKATAVSQLWAAMNAAPSWTLGRTMISAGCAAGATSCGGFTSLQATSISMETDLGYGNYNSLYSTFRTRAWNGLTILSNFNYSRSLGTSPLAQYNSGNTAIDPWNMQAAYGSSYFDYPLVYSLAVSYAPTFYKSQKGVIGHIVGGWNIAPLFTAQSGSPIGVGYTEGSCTACQAFGEATPPASVTTETENAVFASPFTGGNSRNNNIAGSNGIGTNNPYGLNMFTNPSSIYNEFRPCVLGVDTSCAGAGNIRGLPIWNLDATAIKDIGVWKEGRVGASLSFQFTNILNHFQPSNPSSLSLSSPTTFGRITSQGNIPRNMEFGLRVHF